MAKKKTPPEADPVAAVQALMASYCSTILALRAIAPEFNWSNTVGDFGEYMALAKLGLTRLNAKSSDAVDEQGRTVEVKTCRNSKQINFRGLADRLLVLTVDPSGIWEVLYYGDFAPIAALAKDSRRDNKKVVTLSQIRRFIAGQALEAA